MLPSSESPAGRNGASGAATTWPISERQLAWADKRRLALTVQGGKSHALQTVVPCVDLSDTDRAHTYAVVATQCHPHRPPHTGIASSGPGMGTDDPDSRAQ